MRKTLYIIPGFQEKSTYKIYRALGAGAGNLGYAVEFVEIDFAIPLSKQVFPVKKRDSVLGFSAGAILARLVAQEHACDKLILCSMTPDRAFRQKESKKILSGLWGAAFVNDIARHLGKESKAARAVMLAGDREEPDGADIVVKDTGHRLNARYVETALRVLGNTEYHG